MRTTDLLTTTEDSEAGSPANMTRSTSSADGAVVAAPRTEEPLVGAPADDAEAPRSGPPRTGGAET